MLDSSRAEILSRIGEDDLVLDVGGWAKPFARADWVIDLMPHETRGLYGYDQGSRDDERFSARTWVQRDICDREPWPFDDGRFDFAVCSHTLEDVRDPVWVCSELSRVARAGYVEVPSRLEEQSYGIQGPWVGWGHHHWLVDVEDGGLVFVFKHHIVHGPEEYRLPPEYHAGLSAEQKVETLFWEATLPARERVFVGTGELEKWLAALPASHRRGGLLRRLRRP